MAFVTYILLLGYVKGTHNSFSPEMLIQAIWSCVLVEVCEAGAMKLGLNIIQSNLPFLDLLAYSSYKYVGLCAITLSTLFGSTIYFVVAGYAAMSVSFFVMKSMAAAVPASSGAPASGPPRHIVLFGFAAMQFAVTFMLAYL